MSSMFCVGSSRLVCLCAQNVGAISRKISSIVDLLYLHVVSYRLEMLADFVVVKGSGVCYRCGNRDEVIARSSDVKARKTPRTFNRCRGII